MLADHRVRSVSIEIDDRRPEQIASIQETFRQFGFRSSGSFRSPMFADSPAQNFHFIRALAPLVGRSGLGCDSSCKAEEPTGLALSGTSSGKATGHPGEQLSGALSIGPIFSRSNLSFPFLGCAT